ncbi:MAG: LAGLIDADG family homing endonuclease [Candidatus Binatia bacterium]
MNVLLLDATGSFLDFALRCRAAGHNVRLCIARDKVTKQRVKIGDGLVEKIENEEWQKHTNWADLILTSDNVRWLKELDVLKRRGFPVMAPSFESANLELLRVKGQEFFRNHGISVVDYEVFRDYKKAIAYVRSEMERFVSKPDGDVDKALSYVSKSPADMIYMLQRWDELNKLKDSFMLQRFVGGIEFAVAGWMGPKGFTRCIEENFEFKKLMNDDHGPNCFTPDAEVLTQDGWKFWPDVTEHDDICTLKEGQITYDKPIKVVVGDFDGELIGWKSPTIDLLVTPGHNLYVQDDHYRQPFFFETALEAESKRRTIARGSGMWIGEAPLIAGAEEYAALLGIYIADGNCHHNEVIFGNLPEHKKKEFISIITAAGYRFIDRGYELSIGGKLANSFRDFGLAHEKYVPAHIKNATVSVIKAFLWGYNLGDGNQRESNMTFTTVSQRLANDLQELALKVGWCASIRIRDRRNEPGHEIKGYICYNKQIAYEVGVSQQKLKSEISPDTCYRERYKGKVYCVTVPSHVIYVRRNGKACWSGQTGEMGTAIKYVENSQLAKEVLLPLERDLLKMGHRGCVDVSVIIDENGEPRPLEFTSRPGWPSFNIVQPLHGGDPCEWMAALLDGEDIFNPLPDIAIGVVLTIPDFPYSKMTKREVSGIPIYGLDDENPRRQLISPCEVMDGKAPAMDGDKLIEKRLMVSTGDYLAVCTGLGDTVQQAKAEAYKTVETLEVPNSLIMRTDIGDRLKKQLPKLQGYGFAQGWTW